MLEYTLIKQHRPRFNIRLRDDKSYPFLAVTVDEQFPRALVMRGRKRKGTSYFGPYAHAYAIRDTLDLLLRSFPIRTCSPGKFNEHQRLGRPCLLFHIEKCSGPCVGEIGEADYRQLVNELCDFLDGDTDEIVQRLDAEMRAAADEPGVRARGAPARPAVGRAAGDREAADGRRAQRGHRRHRHRRRRARSGGAGVLRAQGPGGRAQGFRASTRSRSSAPAGSSTASSRSCTATSRRSACPSRCSSRSSPTTSPPTRSGSRTCAVRRCRSASRMRGDKRDAARDGDAQRQGGVHAPSAAPRRRSQRPQPGAHRAAGPARTCPRRRCGSSATTWPTCRAPTTSDRWWCWRTACRTSASTAGSRSRTCRATTTTRRWRRCSPGG